MNRLVNIVLLLIVLISLVSFTVNAATIGDGFKGAFNRIENFFSGGWQNYEKTVAFIVFFFLFFPAFLIGAKKAFGGELTRSHIVFTLVAAFLSATIITTTMRFDWINLKYVGWFLIGALILAGIYRLLIKVGFEKNKLGAFILALLITALLLWLLWIFMGDGRPLEGLGDVSDWFGELGEGGTRRPGRRAVTAPIDGGGEVEEKEGKTPWGLIGGGGAGLAALVVALVFALNKKKNKKNGAAGAGGVAGAGGGLRPIEDLIKTLERLLERIKFILKSSDKLVKEKKELTDDNLNALNEEIKKAGNLDKFYDEILPQLKNKDSDQFEHLNSEYKMLPKLWSTTFGMKRLLKILRSMEDYMIEHKQMMERHVKNLVTDDSKLNALIRNLAELNLKASGIIAKLNQFSSLTQQERLTEDQLHEKLSKNEIEQRVKDDWLKETSNLEKHLIEVHNQELKKYENIRSDLTAQYTILGIIIRALKEGEEKEVAKATGLKPYARQSNIVFAGNPEDLTGMAWLAEKKDRVITIGKLNRHFKWANKKIGKITGETERIAKQVKLNEEFFGNERFDVPKNKVFEGKPFPHQAKNRYATQEMNIFKVFDRMSDVYRKLHDEKRWKDFYNVVRRVAGIVRRKEAKTIEEVEEEVKEPGIGKFEKKGKRLMWKGFNNVNEGGKLTKRAKEVQLTPKEKDIVNTYLKYIWWWQVMWNYFELGVWQMSRLIKKINEVAENK